MFGTDIPQLRSVEYTLLSDEEKKLYIDRVEFANKTMGNVIRLFTDYVKRKYPDMSIEHNFASSIASKSIAGCGEEVADCCDYVGGDLYGDMYTHSFACKYFKNINKIFK